MSNPLLLKNFVAGAAVAPFRIVKFSAADTVIQATGPTDLLIGVNDEIAPANGERTDTIMFGICYVEAGATYALTAHLTSDGTGRAVAAAPGAGVNANCIGYPIDIPAAAGDIVRMLISQHSLQG